MNKSVVFGHNSNCFAHTEDRATLGSDPSAPYEICGKRCDGIAFFFVLNRFPETKAINPFSRFTN